MKILFDLYEYNERCRFVLGNKNVSALIAIGVNPSIATNIRNDNTISKLRSIIQSYTKYNGLIMLNLYPEISPKPSDMPLQCNQQFYQENLQHIKTIFQQYQNNDILACWGNNISIRNYLLESLKEIYQINNKINANRKWLCLNNLTKKGNPTHPLYQPKDSTLELFDIKKYIEK